MAPQNAQALLDSANVELQKGNLAAGEKFLENYLRLVKDNPGALDLAARLALHKGDPQQAAQYAQRAVGLQSLLPFVLTLAEAIKANGDTQKAADYFAKVIEKNPKEYRALVGLGEIYEQAGYRQRALELYGAALGVDPSNAGLAVKYAGLLPIADLQKTVPILEQARPPADASEKKRMNFLFQYVLFKEWATRAQHGLLPYHASRLEDSFFNYAGADRDEYERIADSLLGRNPEDSGAVLAKALCLLSRDQRLDCERYFKMTAKSQVGIIYDNIEFQPDFYRTLEAATDVDLAQGLPPLTEVATATFTENEIIYLSCNYDYFVSFARPMLLSLARVGKRPQIHLHIMDGSDQDWSQVASFCAGLDAVMAVSAERPGVDKIGKMEARCYYHSIRFLRLLHHLKTYGKTLWLMDVDALANRDPRSLFAQMNEHDVAFRARPGRWEPWNQYNASVIGVRPTAKAQSYLRLIAAYISHFHRLGRLRWGIDQLAMYGVYKYLEDDGRAPAVFLLDDRAVDYEYLDDGYVWCSSGRGKFQQLERMSKGKTAPTDLLQAKYFNAFKAYTEQLNA